MVRERAPAWAAFFLPLVLYLATMVPTIHLGDSGELTVGAAFLAVVHAPGYQLLVWLGHTLFALPLAHLAWRGNLFSVIAGALAAYMTYRFVFALTGRRLAALAAALIFASGATMWEQSIKFRAYPLNTFFAALIFYLALRWRQTFDRRYLLTAAFVFGLGLANHEILLVAAALPLVWILAHFRRVRPGDWLLGALLLVAGLGVYAYLPVRANTDPILNWGDPSRLSSFLDVMLQRQYAHKIFTATWHDKRIVLEIIARSLVNDMGPAAFLAAVAGLIVLARREAAGAFGLILVVAANVYLRINYIGEGEFDQVLRYMITAQLVVAVGVGVLVARLADLSFDRTARAAVIAFAAFLVAWPVAANWRANQQAANWVAYEAWQNALAHPTPGYALVVGGDNNLFPLWYHQWCERRRPDVAVVPRHGFRAKWSLAMIAANLPADLLVVRPDYRDAGADALFLSTLANLLDAGRPPLALVFDQLREPAADRFFQTLRERAAPVQEGALSWWLDPGSFDLAAVWRFYETTAIRDTTLHRDHHTETVAADYGVYYNRLGLYDQNRGELDRAQQAYHHAVQADARGDAAMSNLAGLLARRGNLAEARGWYDRAIAVAPGDWRHHHNLAIVLDALGRPDEAASERAAAARLRI